MSRPCTDTTKFLTPLQPDEAKALRTWLRGRPQPPSPDPRWRLVTPLLGMGHLHQGPWRPPEARCGGSFGRDQVQRPGEDAVLAGDVGKFDEHKPRAQSREAV